MQAYAEEMHLSIDQKIALKISFSILLIDIDFFKRVNDTYGHAEGDLVLKNIAEMMQKNFRKDDVCCRYGGEEFIVIVPDVSQQDVYESAERFRREVEAQSIEKVGSITVSIGIASWPEASEDISEVFILADKNLYEAKNSGRNCVRL